MIWHIVKKDLRLLWPFALILALVYVARAWISVTLGMFGEPRDLQTYAAALPYLVKLGMVVLIGAVVQQDAILGTTQDWLTRPVSRRNILLAKLLFILVAIHGPLFVIDLIEVSVDDMPFTTTVVAALNNGFYKFCLISLPAAMLASMTASLMPLIIGGIVMMAVFWLPLIAMGVFGSLRPTLDPGGVGWLPPLLWALIGIVAAAIILPRQYTNRATFSSRLVAVGFMAVAVLSNFVPWETGFAIQQLLASQPGAAAAVAVSYAPDMAKSTRTINGAVYDGAPENRQEFVYVDVPLRITGLVEGSVFFKDNAFTRIIDGSGRVIASGSGRDLGETLNNYNRDEKQRAAAHKPPGHIPAIADSYASGVLTGRIVAGYSEGRNRQRITIPAKFYEEYQQQTLRIEIDYSFTVLQPHSKLVLPAVGNAIATAQGLRCATRLEKDEYYKNKARVNCQTAGKMPSCNSITLTHSAPLARPDYELVQCNPDYAPYGFGLNQTLIAGLNMDPSLIRGFVRYLPYSFDLARPYTYDGTKLSDAEIVVKTYEAQDHFTRHVVIPEIRLVDYVARTPKAI